MVASTEIASVLREQLAPLGYVSMRRMFGNAGRHSSPGCAQLLRQPTGSQRREANQMMDSSRTRSVVLEFKRDVVGGSVTLSPTRNLLTMPPIQAPSLRALAAVTLILASISCLAAASDAGIHPQASAAVTEAAEAPSGTPWRALFPMKTGALAFVRVGHPAACLREDEPCATPESKCCEGFICIGIRTRFCASKF